MEEEAVAAAKEEREKEGGEGLACLPSEITAFESKAHAKNDYFHVGKRGEMAARALSAEHSRRAAAVCLREGGEEVNISLKRQRRTGHNCAFF